MFEPFIINAILAGVGVAIITGVMGCFVVWRRMAYFGDSLAHSALLGIAVGFAFGLSVNLGVLIVCLVFAMLLLWMQQKRVLATDTLLGILSHAALSIGMVTIAVLGIRLDLHAYFFGDILTITNSELWWIYSGGAFVLLLLWMNWPSLVLMTISEDLARAENVNTFLTQMLLMVLMTIVVAVSIRTVGILLITSMLIIPVATARQLARSPEIMAFIAVILGILAVVGGITGSYVFDLPSGPAIVVTSALLFALLFSFSQLFLSQRA